MNKKIRPFYQEDKCLNCHTSLRKTDHYCPNCGQEKITKKLVFKDLFSELFSGLFAYDSRFIRTLRVLLFKPGKISKDYIAGKRIRYVNPYRFFLTSAILFFIIYGTSNSNPIIDADAVTNEVLTNKNTYKEQLLNQTELDTSSFFSLTFKKIALFKTYYHETHTRNTKEAFNELNLEANFYNKWLYHKVINFDFITKNPELFKNYVISKSPFIVFLFLPVFALFLALLYIRSSYNYMEHLIFIFHTQSLFFIVYTLGILIDFALQFSYAQIIIIILFCFYLYKCLRNFYQQGRFKTLLKLFILNFIFFILATFVAVFSIFGSFIVF